MSPNSYRVGIDLGTTNCVVSYLSAGVTEPLLLSMPQVMADNSVQEFDYLPSAIYLLAEDETPSTVLPWTKTAYDNLACIVGSGALALGQRRADQLVQSAKSWLSHSKVDRRAKILPWGSENGQKLSPLQASKILLAHIRASWNQQFPEALLEEQEVALTLPASFDEEARALTLEAAKLAGLKHLYLLEEPQAACYYYMNDDAKLAAIADKKMLLVVDIGGGTSDFSLVEIKPSNTQTGEITLKRIAVGDHLLLGGDNLDQALAFQLDPQQISALSTSRLAALVQQTRQAKEQLLAANAPEKVSITVLGGGRRLIGGSQKFDVYQQALLEQVETGFLPNVTLSDKVVKSSYGMHTLGLPYEADAAFTRHLGAFLTQHQSVIVAATGHSMPDAVLFNGGLFNSQILKQRFLDQLTSWSDHPLLSCLAPEPNSAVAKGAALYLSALAGEGKGIESGAAHSLYLQLADDQFVGILPKGTHSAQAITLEQTFYVAVGEPVQFPLYRADDSIECLPGALHDASGMHFVSNLTTELDSQCQDEQVAVQVSAQLTEVGVLQVSLVARDSNDQWQLDFSTQAKQELASSSQEELLHANTGAAEEHLMKCFSNVGQKQFPDLVKSLKQDLDQLLGSRDTWNLATSRRLVDKLLSLKSGRSKSPVHERQWLQLVGFCLRPGCGDAADKPRVEQVIKLTKAGALHDSAPVWGQYWTLYRRIAGGLSVMGQQALLKEFNQFYSPAGQRSREKMKALTTRSSDDLIRLVGALEALALEDKQALLACLLKRLNKSSEPDTAWWSVGRLASRHLLSGQSAVKLPETELYPILDACLKEDWKKRKQAGLAAVLMSQVCLDETDKMPAYRKKVANKLKKDKCPSQWLERLNSVDEINDDELNALLGESLPIGLRL
ncbi:Hsp70 family protein [Marinomonas dokdonensis]|uniref:Hsp70 family protein n=1 Tax=Marinomonas dokdonensis TaxID=328224 RepID=UPI0040554CA3